MGNSNYIKGRRKEYKIVNDLKAKGWTLVQRTAGSHSEVDVLAIHAEKKLIRLIQAKPDSMNAHQQQKLRDKNIALNGTFEVSFSVV